MWPDCGGRTLAKDDVLAVQPRRHRGRDEELQRRHLSAAQRSTAQDAGEPPGRPAGQTWEPLVSLPELAMDSMPGSECLSAKFSSWRAPWSALLTLTRTAPPARAGQGHRKFGAVNALAPGACAAQEAAQAQGHPNWWVVLGACCVPVPSVKSPPCRGARQAPRLGGCLASTRPGAHLQHEVGDDPARRGREPHEPQSKARRGAAARTCGRCCPCERHWASACWPLAGRSARLPGLTCRSALSPAGPCPSRPCTAP